MSAAGERNNKAYADLASKWMVSNKSFSFPDTDTEEYGKRKAALRRRWDTATSIFPNNLSKSSRWFDRILQLHSEERRHYHTLVHLEEMIGFLETLQQHEAELRLLSNARALLLAIFFHDAIYDSRSATNEEDSAALFQEFSSDMGICRERNTPDRVVSFILATKDHKASSRRDLCCGYLLDIDMAVLAKVPSAYVSYAYLIRKEYEFVERLVYCEKRSKVLQTFLEASHIFCTELMRGTFEVRARDNLRKEIESLQRSIIPGPGKE